MNKYWIARQFFGSLQFMKRKELMYQQNKQLMLVQVYWYTTGVVQGEKEVALPGLEKKSSPHQICTSYG